MNDTIINSTILKEKRISWMNNVHNFSSSSPSPEKKKILRRFNSSNLSELKPKIFMEKTDLEYKDSEIEKEKQENEEKSDFMDKKIRMMRQTSVKIDPKKYEWLRLVKDKKDEEFSIKFTQNYNIDAKRHTITKLNDDAVDMRKYYLLNS